METLPLAVRDAIGSSSILVTWYQYGVLFGFVLALVATAWIFLDSRQALADTTLWKAAGAVGAVLLVPFLLARISPDFAIQMAQSLALLGYVSMAGLVLALGAAAAYTATRRADAPLPPTAAGGWPQPMAAPGWPQPPAAAGGWPQPTAAPAGWQPGPWPGYGPTPAPSGQTPWAGQDFGQGGQIDPTQGSTAGAGGTGSAGAAQETMAATMAGGTLSGTGFSGGGDNQKTQMLVDPKAQAPLAWLAFKSGRRAGTVLKLKANDVTRIGRGAAENDHVIDDPHVSRQHVSIRHRDGQFVLRDQGSSTLTFVRSPGDPDFREVDVHTLKSNDTIRLGQTELVFMRVDDAPEAPA